MQRVEMSVPVGVDMLITGSNVPLRAVTYEGLVLCDAEGHVKRAAQGLKPSKETRFHLDVYRLRPEINYIIHAHPTYSVLWTLQKKAIAPLHRVGKAQARRGAHLPDRHPVPQSWPMSWQKRWPTHRQIQGLS